MLINLQGYIEDEPNWLENGKLRQHFPTRTIVIYNALFLMFRNLNQVAFSEVFSNMIFQRYLSIWEILIYKVRRSNYWVFSNKRVEIATASVKIYDSVRYYAFQWYFLWSFSFVRQNTVILNNFLNELSELEITYINPKSISNPQLLLLYYTHFNQTTTHIKR